MSGTFVNKESPNICVDPIDIRSCRKQASNCNELSTTLGSKIDANVSQVHDSKIFSQIIYLYQNFMMLRYAWNDTLSNEITYGRVHWFDDESLDSKVSGLNLIENLFSSVLFCLVSQTWIFFTCKLV
jgi:hypothetical protein